ncbi:MAG: hypothetical protein NWP98_00630, partial [Erythrobacter sp.]|nr:hypothetical protein [Erythrobacter sp.]
MKKTILTGASVLALAIAAPALAQSNQSTVTQTGSGQSADVTQSGANDLSTVTQSNADNEAEVVQAGVLGGTSDIVQSGTDNFASVSQSDDGDVVIPGSVPPSSISTVDQTGNGNSATVAQTTQSQVFANESDIDQLGNNNIA